MREGPQLVKSNPLIYSNVKITTKNLHTNSLNQKLEASQQDSFSLTIQSSLPVGLTQSKAPLVLFTKNEFKYLFKIRIIKIRLSTHKNKNNHEHDQNQH